MPIMIMEMDGVRMKTMKKLMSILLATLLLGSIAVVGTSAAAAPQAGITQSASPLETMLISYLKGLDWEKITDTQVTWIVNTIKRMKDNNVEYAYILDAVANQLPYAVKSALHDAGLAKFPIWERSAFFNFIFKWLLFGWIWM